MINPHRFTSFTTPDTFAECEEGVTTELYSRIWNDVMPAMSGRTLKDAWSLFTSAEQEIINNIFNS